MNSFNQNDLADIGFEKIGDWLLNAPKFNNGFGYSILKNKVDTIEIGNALYAFVCGDDVKYIGKTTRGIKKRFVGYVNPANSQTTNEKCNNKIKELLNDSKTVEIWAFTPTIPLQILGFEINIAAGLEDSLINKFKPEWNGKNKLADDTSDLVELPETDNLKFEDNIPDESLATFTITLGVTYYKTGFINVPVTHTNKLSDRDGDDITILLGDNGEYVSSKINRTANINGAIRIIGNNAAIRDWFQQNFNMGDIVNADILSSNIIRLNSSFRTN